MSIKQKNKILIFGYGYVGAALANELNDFEVVATSRNNKTSDKIRIISFNQETIKEELKDTTHIISTIPPDSNIGDPVLYNFRDIIIEAPILKYISYLSATSVYGDHKGNWVIEESTLNLSSRRSKNRYKSEQEWIEIRKIKAIPIIIFRISGIYGPGRNIFKRIKEANVQNIYQENHNFSRIHIDDIVISVKASIKLDKKHNIYNLADNMPSPQFELIDYAYQLINQNPPKRISFEKADLSEMAKEFYTQNKRVSNNKIKKQLGIKLKYSSYKEGLKALIKEQ